MSGGWAVFVIVAILGIAAFFFGIGIIVGTDIADPGIDEDYLRSLEAERAMHEIDRAAFTAMLARVEGDVRRRRPPSELEHGDP